MSQEHILRTVELTLVPLLGPIGGGLGFVAAAPSGSLVAAAGGTAPSSDALITNLALFLALLLLFEEKNNILLRLEAEPVLLVATFGVTTNPEAADAMLQLAILLYVLGWSLSLCDGP